MSADSPHLYFARVIKLSKPTKGLRTVDFFHWRGNARIDLSFLSVLKIHKAEQPTEPVMLIAADMVRGEFDREVMVEFSDGSFCQLWHIATLLDAYFRGERGKLLDDGKGNVFRYSKDLLITTHLLKGIWSISAVGRGGAYYNAGDRLFVPVV